MLAIFSPCALNILRWEDQWLSGVFLKLKDGWHIRLHTSTTTVSRLSRKCKNFNFQKPSGSLGLLLGYFNFILIHNLTVVLLFGVSSNSMNSAAVLNVAFSVIVKCYIPSEVFKIVGI
jgi:hypothetical protein